MSDARDVLPAALVVSDIGLGVGILLISPAVDSLPWVVGTANALGAAGAVTGARVAALATDDWDSLFVASLVGGAAGTLGGGFLGAALERKNREGRIGFLFPRPNLRLPGSWTVAPTIVTDGESTGWGVGLQVADW